MNSFRQLMRLKQARLRVGRTDVFGANATRPFVTTGISSPQTVVLLEKPLTQPKMQTTSKRFLAAPSVAAAASTPPVPPPSINYDDLVKETMKKMVNEREQPEVKPITDAELEVRFNRFKKVYEEAELCLIDLQDAAGAEHFDDEAACARGAVENTFTAYIDLLEDLRRANDEQLQCYSEVRNSNACNLKRLRQQLDALLVSHEKVA